MLGVLSGVLGGFLFIFYYTTLLGSGAPIWTGAVVSGAGGPWAGGPLSEVRDHHHRPHQNVDRLQLKRLPAL